MLEKHLSVGNATRAGIRLERPYKQFSYNGRLGVAYLGRNAYGDSFLIAEVPRSTRGSEYFLGSYPDKDMRRLRLEDRRDLALSAVARDLRIAGRDINFSIATLLSRKQPKR